MTASINKVDLKDMTLEETIEYVLKGTEAILYKESIAMLMKAYAQRMCIKQKELILQHIKLIENDIFTMVDVHSVRNAPLPKELQL